MKNRLREINEKINKQEEKIRRINKQLKRQKWMNVYFLWSR
ncbi:MAG: hypothetical protein PHH54_01585 [Candidatus Nanoarchaeia archaeon]|nr:hypothetical protein [Candidatus Nanoarchaeia archaeon]MDD5740655.1 hypothetical protein [Candidatus Nanoarchaeia archaeon]